MHKRSILKSNKGSSLILVAALTVVIIGLTVSLRILAGIIMASANQQLNQDQAYELATSLGNALEERIINGEEKKEDDETYVPKKALLELKNNTTLVDMSGFDGMPDASVTAKVMIDEGGRSVLTVRSKVGKASYIWKGIYQGSYTEGYKKCAE